jgi:hypothetical protein
MMAAKLTPMVAQIGEAAVAAALVALGQMVALLMLEMVVLVYHLQ